MTDLTNEQVLAQLQTRGFETGGFGSPLKHFRGKLTSITGSMVQRGQMTQARLEVNYNFDEIEVFDSTEPYPSPVAQISLLHSNRDKSGMGVLGHSIDAIINAGTDDNATQVKVKNQDFLIGKVQEWKATPGHMMWDSKEGKETSRQCWEVVFVEGVGGTPHSGVTIPTNQTPAPAGTPASPTGVTPTQQALGLLDGKTQQEWNSIIFQNQLVKGDQTLIDSIISGKFIQPLVDGGILTKDENGVYHVKD